KCTLCFDRQRDGLEPACAKPCPTQPNPLRPYLRFGGWKSETRRSVNSPLIRPTRYPHFALGAAIECESLHRVVEAVRHSGEYGPPVAGRSGRSPGIGDRATVGEQHGVDRAAALVDLAAWNLSQSGIACLLAVNSTSSADRLRCGRRI